MGSRHLGLSDAEMSCLKRETRASPAAEWRTRSQGSVKTSPRPANARSDRRVDLDDSRAPIVQRNLDVHKRAIAAVNAGDVPRELLAPGFRIEGHMSAVTDYVYRGPVGWGDWVNDLFEVFADGARYQVEEIVATGTDFVVAALCIAGRGARSSMPLEFRWVCITWFSAGLIARAVGYASRREALAALTLSNEHLTGGPQPGR